MTVRPPRESLLTRLSAPEAAPPWSLTVALATLIVAFIALIGGSFFGLLLFPLESFVSLAGWTFGALLLANFVRNTRSAKEDRRALRMVSPSTPIMFIMFVTFGFALAFDLLGLALTSGTFITAPELWSFNVAGASIVDWVLAIAFMVLAQPAAEEMVFRGVLLPSLRGQFGAWAGLIINALLFAVFHFIIYTPSGGELQFATIWYGFGLAFLNGSLLACVRIYTNSTRAAVFAHAMLGLFAVVKLLLISLG